MWRLWSVALLGAALRRAAAQCPSMCSGHGECGGDNMYAYDVEADCR